MGKDTKKRVVGFIVGAVIVTLVSSFGTMAFFQPDLYDYVRNIVITDVAYVGLYIVWIRLHKNYETMYKSSLEEEK